MRVVVPPAWRSEDGSALLTALAMIALLSVLIGAVWMVQVAQYRFFRRDAHRAMARYAAEAGLYVALDSLEQNPYWQEPDLLMELPADQRARVTVEPFGAYLYVRSLAQQGRSQAAVRALIGEVPAPEFNHAVVLWDTESSLNVAGTTRIEGTVVVGERGVRESTFERRRFTGDVRGPIRRDRELEAPFADFSFFDAAVADAERLMRRSTTPPPEIDFRLRDIARLVPSDNPITRVEGTLRLTSDNAAQFARPVTLIATGDLVLEGPLHLLPGTMLLAGQGLDIRGPVTGSEVLFYGRNGVTIGDGVRCAAQVFSEQFIRLTDDAYLEYPSVLYVTGKGAEFGGAIEINNQSVMNGTVVHPSLEPEPLVPAGRIVVADSARVRGGVFNMHQTELHGTVYGSVLSHQFYFYDSPTSYVNWLLDVNIEPDERPIKYLLPLRFNEYVRLGVVAWDVVVDEVPGNLEDSPL